MVIALPHQSSTEYLRDFIFGALAELCLEECPCCGAMIDLFGLRLRKYLDVPVIRGRCRGARPHHFTFLPLFVAPAKWHGYSAIENALRFVSQPEYANQTEALAAWEAQREIRIDDGETPGPSVSAIRRWWAEMSENHPDRPWLDRAREARQELREEHHVSSSDPGVAAPTMIESKPRCSNAGIAAMLLAMLTSLGAALLGGGVGATPDTYFATGIWFLENRHGQRCLARADLVGNVVPAPVPDLAVTLRNRRTYPLEPP